MKFENTEVWGFNHAIRGMRNPMNSWDKSDSHYIAPRGGVNLPVIYNIGKNDLKLMQKLIRAGNEHRKFMRQIMVSVDITAPSYFMAELDTYKIGITRNSCSFMHKGVSKPFEIEDFECDDARIAMILSIRKLVEKNQVVYPYETNEYRIYTTGNGRQYEVFKNGRIFALPFTYTDTIGRTRSFDRREIKPSITRDGYWEVNIGGRGGEKWLLHRLVGYVWLDNPNNYETIDHLNADKNNNSAENLEWVSRVENVKRELAKNASKTRSLKANYSNWKCSTKATPFDKIQIIDLYKKGYTQKQLAEKYDISRSQISAIIRNENNTSDNSELFETCWIWEQILTSLNKLRDLYLETKDYKYFRLIRQYLPHSYLYRSTFTMSYENIFNMVHQRKNHKLYEWSGDDNSFISWARSLPYAQELIFLDKFDKSNLNNGGGHNDDSKRSN